MMLQFFNILINTVNNPKIKNELQVLYSQMPRYLTEKVSDKKDEKDTAQYSPLYVVVDVKKKVYAITELSEILKKTINLVEDKS
jgi:hypothetical protein